MGFVTGLSRHAGGRPKETKLSMRNKPQHFQTRLLVATFAGLAVATALAQQIPGLKYQDVGSPTLPGSTTYSAATGKYTIVGGGNDIWNNSDNFHYAYITVTGDFDYIVRCEDLQGPDNWTKAELMAREIDEATYGGPDGTDRHISVMTTRTGGQNEVALQWRSNARGSGSAWPNDIGIGTPLYRPTYPNTWLRLERVGSRFWGYASQDGVTWTELRGSGYDFEGLNGTETEPRADGNMANTLAIGMAVTAHNDGDPNGATAIFSGFRAWTPVPIEIVTQPPATISVPANSTLTITASVTGDPVHYQWYKGVEPIPGATSATYTKPLAQMSDSGTYTVRCFGANQTPVTSTPCVVTITQDTTPPTMVKAVGSPTLTGVTITFSEPVVTGGTFAITPSLAVTGTTVSPDGFKVTLTTARQTEGTIYTITVNGVRDTAGNTIAPNSTIQFNSAVFKTGLVAWERYNGGGSITQFIDDLANNALPAPDVTWVTGLFESGRNMADNYRGRGYAWFKPATTGNYVFIITADDNARLFLSTDDNPANKKAIAAESQWSNNREWSSATEEQRSDSYAESEWPSAPTITLQAGRSYYLEALWQEGGGGDGCEVTIIREGDATPANGTPASTAGGELGIYVDPTTLPPVISDPTAMSAVVLDPGVTHTLSVTAEGATSFQWQWNGRDIPGANSANYVISNAKPIHSGQYWCIASNKNGTVRSAAVNVMVKAKGVFAIEAEDFDYDGGKTLPEASVMPYLGGAYEGLSAIHGVDYLSNNGTDSPVYRGGAVLEAGTAAPMANDMGGQFAITRMGEWEMTTNYKIGWIDGGDWGNYTRTFPSPAKKYWVFAAQSYDGFDANQLNSNLGLVTAGVGTANQTVQALGRFNSVGSGGWSRNNIVALTDDAGAIKTVELGGKLTIRWNYSSGDVDWLAFVPAEEGPTAPGAAKIARSGNNVVISEDPPAGATVQSAPSVNGPWNDVGPAPQTIAITGQERYFRLKR